MDQDRTGRQLRLIAEVVRLAERSGVAVWLRGGWAVDFALGDVTREHRDIDWFTWAATLPRLRARHAAQAKDADDIRRLQAR